MSDSDYKSSTLVTLLPCPFCGNSKAPGVFSHAEIHNIEDEDEEYAGHPDSFAVVCDCHVGGCGAACGYELDKDKAAAEWNRRAP